MAKLRQVLADAVDERLERAHREGGAGAAVLELVEHFPFLVERVKGGDNAAGEQSAIEGDKVFRAVRGEDGDAVAFLDPGVLEVAAEPTAGLPGLAEGVAIPFRSD